MYFRTIPWLLITILLISAFALYSCDRNYSPNPRGFFRVDYPVKDYNTYLGDCPFSFQYPEYAEIYADTSYDAEPCWKHIYYKPFNAYVHLSYKPVSDFEGYNKLREDARTFVYEHTVKASDINRNRWNVDDTTEAMKYNISGSAASAVQFYATDSTTHYIRGALYFNVPVNRDSLDPVIDFIEEDIDVMLNTLKWTY